MNVQGIPFQHKTGRGMGFGDVVDGINAQQVEQAGIDVYFTIAIEVVGIFEVRFRMATGKLQQAEHIGGR